MSRLAIPTLPHHTLPYGFYCLSHGRTGVSLSQDLSDATNRALVHALAPESWRLIANIARMGTVAAPTTYDGGGLDYHKRLIADLDAGQTPKPRFLMGFDGGPYGAARPGSGSATDASNYVSSNTVEGSTGTVADWLAYWLAQGYDIMAVEPWNEPANTSAVDLAAQSWFTVASGGSAKAQTWANVMARRYRQALAAVPGSSGVLICHNANGNVAGRNGTQPFQEIILGQGYISGWPWPDTNIAGQAFTGVSLHGYSEGNQYQDAVNSLLYPVPTWGQKKHGLLVTFDYCRKLLDDNGGAAIPLVMSEYEPINAWGNTGRGVSADAVIAIVCAARQAAWKMQTAVWMDVARDESTIQSTANIGDQMLYPPSTATGGKWKRGARYFGQLQIIGRFLKKYKNIGRVPLYTGDAGDATWVTVPGVTAGGANANPVQRHQAIYGYDSAGNLAVLVTDVYDGGAAEQLQLDLPFDPVAAKVTRCPAGYAAFADTPFTETTFTVASRTLTTNAGGVPSLGGGDTMLFEFTAPSSAPPPGSPPTNTAQPTVIGTLTAGSTLTAGPGTWAGNPTPTLTYQWEASFDGVRWFELSGETATTLLLDTEAHVGLRIRVAVTGTNVNGTLTGRSAATAAVARSDGNWIGNPDVEADITGFGPFQDDGETVTRDTTVTD